MVQISNPDRFKFDTPEGEKSLVDIFDGRNQLIIYHFMLGPGEHAGCVGCSFCMDHIPNLEHRAAEIPRLPLSLLPHCLRSLRIERGWMEVPFLQFC